MKIKITIPPKILFVINLLRNSGYEAGVVGGCTRDSIMGICPNDWDICTSATPKEIQNVFKDFKQLDMGLKHGTIVVIIDNEEIEITTYRIDGTYSDGRRPDKVNFTRNLIEDLSRRDYTINAIFYNDEEGIIDPFNGTMDIKNKLIKSVGNADKRFKEDALRILRGIRLASKLGFFIEENTKKAMFSNKELLKKISQERITIEFIKLIQGKDAVKVLDEFKDIICYIIPEITPMIGFNQNNPYHIYDVWHHSLIAVKNTDNLILRLTMLFHDIGKPYCYTLDEKAIGHFYGHEDISAKLTSEIFKRMKITNSESLSKDDVKTIIKLIKYHDITIEHNKKDVKKWLFKLDGDEKLFKLLLEVKKIDTLAKCPKIQDEILNSINTIEVILKEILAENPCITLKDLSISGKDLINLGIPKGKKIGEILNILLQDVINEKIPNNKELLLLEAKKIKDN